MLIEFYGRECPHCHNMDPLVDKLEKETGAKLEKYEVWHDQQNAEKMSGYDKGRCGGVPFFYNTENDGIICGEVDYADLKTWSGK